MTKKKLGGLQRRLGLPLLVLYGTGTTIGAGIYVLIGEVSASAGMYAPVSFVIAGIVMGLTVASYAELCTRYPVAAGEAAYVRAAFGSKILSTITGLLMIVTAVIASAAVSIGATGYIAQFVDLPKPLIITVFVALVGLICAWGILESVLLAVLFTVLEVGGLVAIIAAAAYAGLPVQNALLTVPPADPAVWNGIIFASLLAFFAFIGFEDLTNIVEEAHAPTRNIPLAMVLTLAITSVLYVAIAAIAVTAIPLDRLAASGAPLAIVYRELGGFSVPLISLIAIGATANTVIAQTTMATRVVYGMARMGDLPEGFGEVSTKTSTPLAATALISAIVLVLALFVPFGRLAEFTSLATLLVFALINAALLRLRFRREKVRPGEIRVPLWMPVLGLLTSLAMIAASVV